MWANHTNPKHIVIKYVRESPWPQNHDPDPLIRLIGKVNIINVVVNNQEYKGLIDSGGQVTTSTESFAKSWELPIQNVSDILSVEGMWK